MDKYEIREQNETFKVSIENVWSIASDINGILTSFQLPNLPYAKYAPPSQDIIDTLNTTLLDTLLKSEFGKLLTFTLPDLPLIEMDTTELNAKVIKGKNNIYRETVASIQSQVQAIDIAYKSLPESIPTHADVYDKKKKDSKEVSQEVYEKAIEDYDKTIENLNKIKLGIKKIIKICVDYQSRISEFKLSLATKQNKPPTEIPVKPEYEPKYDWFGRKTKKNTGDDRQLTLLIQKLKASNYLLGEVSRICLSTTSKLGEMEINDAVRNMNSLYEKFIEDTNNHPENVESLKTKLIDSISKIKASLPEPKNIENRNLDIPIHQNIGGKTKRKKSKNRKRRTKSNH